MRTTTTTLRRVAIAAGAALLITACGGSDDSAEPTSEPAADDSADSDTDSSEADDAADTDEAADAGDDDAEADAETDAGGDDSTSSGSYEPGGSSFRTVNLLDRPVDIYVRTSGLVEAFPVEAGVASGAVTEFASPPEDGRYIVTEAGAGDPTCVSQCDHIITEQSDPVDGDDPFTTVVLYQDVFRDVGTHLALKEDPDSDSPFGASIAPPDPSTGLVIPVGVALDEDVFGFRVGFEGVEGCVTDIDDSNILVGGNQTPTYAYPGDSANILFYEQPDQECTDPVGGPFEITGGPGTRTFVVLTGAPGSLEAVVLDLTGSVDADPAVGGESDEADAGESDESADEPAPTNLEELIEAVLSDAPPGVDEQCVRDSLGGIPEADVAIIIENIDAPELPEGLSIEAQDALAGILDCV